MRLVRKRRHSGERQNLPAEVATVVVDCKAILTTVVGVATNICEENPPRSSSRCFGFISFHCWAFVDIAAGSEKIARKGRRREKAQVTQMGSGTQEAGDSAQAPA